ncbi:MAG: AAA family ATPase [Ktedonobacterales bacterium]|nr:AAA family ATPase [Ktedonobacterales bacterium]
MPTMHISLLGDFRLVYDDVQVTRLNTPRLQAFLAYLVLHREGPQSRHHLAFLFWPDATEAQARTNLRQLLYQLRRFFPAVAQFIDADASMVWWKEEAAMKLDVVDFEAALHRADAATREQDDRLAQTNLAQADALYRGDLLPHCYDEWITLERERLRQRHRQMLDRLLHLYETRGDLTLAIQYAQRFLQADPLAEEAYRHLMRLFARKNDRASALRIYHSCVATLQRELGVEPDPATREAYEQLMNLDGATRHTRTHHPTFATPPALIGRQREWEQLQATWQRASAGGPRFVLITGEAGIGKSRLAEDFLLWVSQQGGTTAKTRSYAAEGQLSLAPVTEWLRSEAVRSHLGQLETVWLTEVARILPELFTVRPDLPHYEPVTESGQRQRFFEAMAHALLNAPQPLAVFIDDLQWCDQETLEWVHFLLRFAPKARLLVMGSARTEELPREHPLHALLQHIRVTMDVTQLALQPMDAAETAQLAAQVTNHAWDVADVMHLYLETQGYPLFVVETLRVQMEQTPGNAADAPAGAMLPPLPPRVHAILLGRLLHLSPPSRALVDLAAVIGRAFTFDLLLAAGTNDADGAVNELDELWQKRIVRELGVNSYDFTHDKLREVAYTEISVPHRRMLHRRIAQALETLNADDLDVVSGQIASHYDRAGLPEQALPFYHRAAEVAQCMYANEDAISLLSRGLALLHQLPAGSKRDAQELSLHLALAPLYRVTKGWAAAEVEQNLDRALALCDTIGDDAQMAQALYGLQSLYVVQARLEKVQLISDELQTFYQRAQGTAPPPFAGMMLAGAHLHLGRIVEANAQFTRIIAAHDPTQLQSLQESQGVNYAALALAWQSQALWCLGYPQRALRCALDAVQMVQDRAQPFNQALVSTYLATLQQLRATDTAARTYAEEALALTGMYQAPYYRVWSAILVSYALAHEQPKAERIANLREAITTYKAEGARLRLPYFLSLLAQVCLQAGRAEDGLAAIDEALTESRSHNEHVWDAELHRLRGDLLRIRGATAEDVLAALLRARTIAQTQQAKSLELRATLRLVQLGLSPNHPDTAKQWLTDIYAWFTEGFDTPDLQAAQRLLSQPGSSGSRHEWEEITPS